MSANVDVQINDCRLISYLIESCISRVMKPVLEVRNSDMEQNCFVIVRNFEI
jgi:hypothetical protein